MPQRIVPQRVVTVTKDGECHVHITLDLNISLNAAGHLQVLAEAEASKAAAEAEPEKDETQWAIPDFGTFNGGLINFGKDVDHADR